MEQVVLRAQSWPDAVEVLRRNIRALADAERTFGRAMKKLASTAAPVSFVGVEKGEGTSKSPKGEVDTLVAATNLCFSACPQQWVSPHRAKRNARFTPRDCPAFAAITFGILLTRAFVSHRLGVQHEATADAFMAVHNGKGGQLERIAKKNRGSIEAAAQGLWEGVVKAREGLAKAKKNKDALVAGAAPGGKMADDRWLVDVQLSHWRIEEREASTIYCTQVLKLAEDAHKAELECVAVLQEVLAAFMQAQCASASKIDVDLEAVARGLKLLDGEEDWKSFQSLKTIEMVRSRQISTEWKEWNVEATHQALCEGTRGDVMAGEGVEGVEKAGWLHRQGTLLSFNWHKQWFVITKYGHLHYFASKESTVPEVAPSLAPPLLRVAFQTSYLASWQLRVGVGIEIK